MKSNELEELGFKENDLNEFSNKDFSIYLVDDTSISIISHDQDNWLCIPLLKCKNKKSLLAFFKMIYYDFEN